MEFPMRSLQGGWDCTRLYITDRRPGFRLRWACQADGVYGPFLCFWAAGIGGVQWSWTRLSRKQTQRYDVLLTSPSRKQTQRYDVLSDILWCILMKMICWNMSEAAPYYKVTAAVQRCSRFFFSGGLQKVRWSSSIRHRSLWFVKLEP